MLQVEFYSTCPTDMPLLSEKDSVLTPDELTALQKALRNSSWLVPLGRRTGASQPLPCRVTKPLQYKALLGVLVVC